MAAVDVRQLAEHLNVSEGWVRKQVLERNIPFSKFGRNIRFTEAQVAEIEASAAVPVMDTRRKSTARTRL